MTFETDMMSCDKSILCMKQLPIQKMKGPTHLIRDKYIYILVCNVVFDMAWFCAKLYGAVQCGVVWCACIL